MTTFTKPENSKLIEKKAFRQKKSYYLRKENKLSFLKKITNAFFKDETAEPNGSCYVHPLSFWGTGIWFDLVEINSIKVENHLVD